MKKIYFTIVCLGLALGSLNAQTKLKFGHVDSQTLLEAMPEKVEADKALETFAKQLESQLEVMSTELETKYQDYQANQAVMSDIIKQTKEEELQMLQQRIQNFQQNAQQSLAKKEGEVYQPILDKAKKAIEDVAVENGFTYVFDTSAGSLLYQPTSDDILNLVKKKLGIAVTE